MRRAEIARLLGLAWTLVRTDFKVRYHGTIGGFVWALLKPLCMFLVLLAVFSYVFPTAPDYRLNLVLGLFLWDFFAEGTKVGLIALHQKGYLLTKARFPAWIVVVCSAANALLTVLVFGVLFTAALTLAGRAPSPLALAFAAIDVLALLVIVWGFSLGASVLFLRYRDLNQVWEVLSQAGFFLAPIIWPIAVLPERLHFWLYLWPPTPAIQFARMALLEGRLPTFRAQALLAALALGTLAIGAAIYRRGAPAAAERL